MLHDLLLSLAGIPGSVFTFEHPQRDNKKLPQALLSQDYQDACHPAEVQSLERLAQLGALLSAIRLELKTKRGVYWEAISATLEIKFKEYNQVILDCERVVLDGHLYTSLAHFEPLL